MRYLSVCSGIEAATCAWHPLGWEPFAFAEVEKFPSAVLAHHYPNVPNLGDMTKFQEWPDATFDVLVGGTPCQSFSVAGLRKGLADPRGNLMLTYGAIAARYRPTWLVWENVPGVLSSNGGRDFGTFLGMLGELGYGFAYRVLDAQYFGVAQRRRRVFVVAHLGDWRRAAAVLFERHSLSGDTAPSREARKVAPTIPSRSTAGGGLGTDFDCDGGVITMAHGQGGAEIGFDRGPTLNCNHEAPIAAYGIRTANTSSNGWGIQEEATHTLDQAMGIAVAHSLRGEGFDASEDGTGRGTPLVPVGVTIHGTDPTVQKVASYDDLAQCLRARTPGNIDNSSMTVVQQPVAFHPTQDPISSTDGSTHALGCGSTGGQASVAVAVALRGREGGAAAELGDEVQNCLRASSGGGDKPYVLVNQSQIGCKQHANAEKTRPIEALRILREAIGEEAFCVWSIGILAALQPAQVLQSRLHGTGFRCATFSRNWVVYCALSRQEDSSAWLLQSLRETECDGCPPQGWEPSEQLTRELGAYLSELSQPGAQAARFVRDLREASEGSGLLRQALSAVQEVGRSSGSETQSAHRTYAVRRLTVEECEFLQGFPRGYTAIPWRGKHESPDGPRYKALGNSMAVPVMRWIGERMQMVESVVAKEAAA